MQQKKYDDTEAVLLHPHKLMLYVTLVGLSVLFVGFSLAYMMSKPSWGWEQFSFPKVFLVSAVVIVYSSVVMQKTLKYFDNDEGEKLREALLQTIGLSIVFILCQVWGWWNLYSQGIYIAGKPDGSYLYLISAIHALHVLVGVFFLVYLWIQTRTKLSKPVDSLLYFSDNYQKRKLQMISLYWHYVDILWIYLLLCFSF